MTGFGKVTAELPSKKVTVEIKALNSKQLDLSTRIPSIYKDKEMELRSLLLQSLERGKVEFNIFIEYIGKDTPTDQSCRRRELLQPNQGDRREIKYQRSERLVPDLAPDAGRNQVRDRRTGRIRMGGGFRNGKGRYQAPV